MSTAPEQPVLVIGYGNELLGDDAAGPRTARAVAEWGLAGVEVLILHQLTPELSEALSRARAVIFLDASTATRSEEVEVSELPVSANMTADPHASDPRALLGLAQALFGRCPPAWLIRIPAVAFELGAPLSATAEQGVAQALRQAQELLRRFLS